MGTTIGEKHDTPSVPVAGHLLPAIVQSIRRDHRTMEQLLGILEQELAIFRRGERPDFDILAGIIEYFRSCPDCRHQPKEALVIAALKEHAPDHALSLPEGRTGGQEAMRNLEHFAELIEYVINEQEVSREAVTAAAEDFAAVVKRWIRLAEGELLPVALENLTSEVWAALDGELASKTDPIVDPALEARLEQLAERLGKWEREDQAERLGSVKVAE